MTGQIGPFHVSSSDLPTASLPAHCGSRNAFADWFDRGSAVVSVRAGTEPREILLALQDRFDTHFVERAAWHGARTS